MTEIDSTSTNAEGDDPLPTPPPLEEDAPLIDRALEAGRDLPPIDDAIRSALGRSALSERPARHLHPVEQAYVAEMSRPMLHRHIEGPRVA